MTICDIADLCPSCDASTAIALRAIKVDSDHFHAFALSTKETSTSLVVRGLPGGDPPVRVW